ncbi:MAG TPA: hypothetical protein VKZ51_04920 [Cyclobacteriaceae bacterium]|nr:hypothetical protein [Cyclobacteriaceae bacterium]
MTAPPANYDAGGDAGFISIITRSGGETMGTHTGLTAGLSYGTDPQGDLSLNINHQGNKLGWFGNYSFDDTDIYIEGRMRTVPRTLAVTCPGVWEYEI